MKNKYKKTLLSMMLLPIFSTGFADANISVERLSLFLDDGTNVYENRQLVDTKNTFPPGLEVTFEEKEEGYAKIWQWKITNNSSHSLDQLKLTGLIDVDISAKDNTFFNETGQLIALNAPKGYIPAIEWEIGEPGYFEGDLIPKTIQGKLSNVSHVQNIHHADDVSIALALPIEKLRRSESLTVIATLNDANSMGAIQSDGETTELSSYFNFYGKKDNKFVASSFSNQNGLITTGAALDDNGEVWIWGFRGSSQQGNGVMVVPSNAPPAKVNSLNNIVQLTGGAYHLLALDKEGNIYGWGQSGYGETGCAPTEGHYVSTPCKVLSRGVQIAAGEYFSVALDEEGQVWTWGHNLYGQLGNSGYQNSQKPIAVNLQGEKARLIGGAYEGAFAVTEEGHVWAWGDNEASGLGIKGTNYGVQQIIRTPTRIPNLDPYANDMVYIAGGNGWGEALLEDGRVIGWGMHASLGQGTMATNISSPEPIVVLEDVERLFARYVGSFALTKEGKLLTWGQTGGSAFSMIYEATPSRHNHTAGKVVEIGGGKEHLFYKMEDGRLYGVGYNDLYKLDQSKCCSPNINWPGSEIKLNQ